LQNKIICGNQAREAKLHCVSKTVKIVFRHNFVKFLPNFYLCIINSTEGATWFNNFVVLDIGCRQNCAELCQK